jgi:hypothetical protein
MTKHRRGRNNIVSGEEQVSVTQTGRLHVDENFAPNGRGDIYVLEIEPTTERIQHKRLHVWPPAVPLSRAGVPERAGRGSIGSFQPLLVSQAYFDCD